MANQAKRNFKQAPLPFVGQKRNFLNHFKAILNEQIRAMARAGRLLIRSVVQACLVILQNNSNLALA